MRLKSLVLALILVLGLAPSLFALDDGFGRAQNIESKYFSVSLAPEISPQELDRKLNINVSEKVITEEKLRRNSVSLPNSLDVLFLRISDILDMHLYNFKGTIKVCRDYTQLNSVFNNLYGKGLGGRFSFYIPETNSIYTCNEYFKKEILGHEIAHAIISGYFVVNPPPKISEILSGYVEYQLRKK